MSAFIDDKQKIKEVISSIVSKNLELLPEFQKKYPQCMNSESKKSDEYNLIIMETMGGDITVASRPGAETTFTLRVPAPPAD